MYQMVNETVTVSVSSSSKGWNREKEKLRVSFRVPCFDRVDTRPDNGQKHRSFFGELTEQHFKHSELLTLKELEGRMRSISVIATRCVCLVLYGNAKFQV